MKFYYHPMSGCSRRVLAFLEAREIDVEHHVVPLQEGAHKQPDFLALNPNGRVPVLVDGDFVLWESGAILAYLAAQFAPEMLGDTPQQRAQVSQWSYWGLAHLGAALGALNQASGLKRMFGGTPDEAEVVARTAEVYTLLAILDAQLANQAFIVGEQATVADYMIAPNLQSCRDLSKLELPEYGNLRGWFARMTDAQG